MLGAIAMFAFLNRWNDTIATPLEAMPENTRNSYANRYELNSNSSISSR